MAGVKKVVKDGHEALVAYVDDNFNPVEYEDAKMMHIWFDNGDSMWAVPQPLETLGEVVG
jgi:hypothetical protein